MSLSTGHFTFGPVHSPHSLWPFPPISPPRVPPISSCSSNCNYASPSCHPYQQFMAITSTLTPFHSLCIGTPTPPFRRRALKLLSLNYTQALGWHLQHFKPAPAPLPITTPFHPTLPTFDSINSPTFMYDPGGGPRGSGGSGRVHP